MFSRSIAALLMLILALPAHAEKRTIQMGTVIYDDILLVALVTKKFLESQGHTVELTRFAEQGILYAALNKGDVEIANSQVNYVTHDLWKRYSRRLEKISVVSHGNYQALVVPSYMPINSIEELPTIAEQVNSKIIGIESGSGLYREASQAVKAYDLNFQLIPGSTPAMAAQLQAALERGDPIVTMLWDTSWMMQKFDVKFLKDPKGIFAPPQTRYWIGLKDFSTKYPDIREALASIYLSAESIRLMGSWVVLENLSFEDAVDRWWQENADLIARWQVFSH